MQGNAKITPCLWFDDQAEDAVDFYTGIFSDSRIVNMSRYTEAGRGVHRRPAGSVMTVTFELSGQPFIALNGGPYFTFTPSISFFIHCESETEINELWDRLSDGGSILMPLQKYPFCERYGWVQDQFGLSWQLMLADDHNITQKIAPSLMFTGEQAGRAEEAMRFYTSVFDHSRVDDVLRYGRGEAPDREGTIKHASFTLEGQPFKAMDSNLEHPFMFNEALSFVVSSETQEEVDEYWEKLSEGGDKKAQQCGWLKDAFGVSWQVVPNVLPEMMMDPDPSKSGRAMEAMLQMKKIDIRQLQRAFAG